MASAPRTLTRVLGPLTRLAVGAAPRAVARRTFVSAVPAPKRAVVTVPKYAAIQARGMKTIDFAGVPETVYGKHMYF